MLCPAWTFTIARSTNANTSLDGCQGSSELFQLSLLKKMKESASAPRSVKSSADGSRTFILLVGYRLESPSIPKPLKVGEKSTLTFQSGVPALPAGWCFQQTQTQFDAARKRSSLSLGSIKWWRTFDSCVQRTPFIILWHCGFRPIRKS